MPRDKVVIASKVYFIPGRLSREAIHREIDGTLKRLGTDYLDLYIIHRFDYDTPIEETMEALHELVQAGIVNRWLGANCFGDYYTRKGLDLRQRELITFCFLSAQGGCEPQLTAHAKGNMNLGNDAAYLTRVVLQCLPYIGYPRSLNAMGCIKKAAE